MFYWISDSMATVEAYKPLKRHIKIPADDTLFFFFYLSKEIRLDVSYESPA